VRLAVALDGNNAVARSCLSYALYLRGDYHGAMAEAERALALSPNLALGYWRRGAALIRSGQPQEGVRDLQTSLRLEPRGSYLGHRLAHMALGFYHARAYEHAVAAAEHAIRSFPEFKLPYRCLAASLGQLGRTEDAKAVLDKAIATAPDSFDMYVRQRVPWQRPEDHAHMLEGLRKAGWQGSQVMRIAPAPRQQRC